LSAASLAKSGTTTADTTASALTDVSAGLTKVAGTLGSVGTALSGGALSGGPVTAVIGRAATVGALSVPQSWGGAAPAMAGSAKASPVTLVSETQDLADMPGPVSLAAPGTLAAGAAARGRPAVADGTTLRSLMRPNMLPRRQYVG
jgi:PPE-repeat protein